MGLGHCSPRTFCVVPCTWLQVPFPMLLFILHNHCLFQVSCFATVTGISTWAWNLIVWCTAVIHCQYIFYFLWFACYWKESKMTQPKNSQPLGFLTYWPPDYQTSTERDIVHLVARHSPLLTPLVLGDAPQYTYQLSEKVDIWYCLVNVLPAFCSHIVLLFLHIRG